MPQANFMLLCFIEPELLPIEFLHYRNMDFRPFFVPVTLSLTRWPSYTNLTCIAWRYTGRADMNFLSRGFLKLSSDRQTDRQTRPQLYTTPLRGWSIISHCCEVYLRIDAATTAMQCTQGSVQQAGSAHVYHWVIQGCPVRPIRPDDQLMITPKVDFYRAACNAAAVLWWDFCLSVRPSVCLSHAWIVTKRKKDRSRFIYHTKELDLS